MTFGSVTNQMPFQKYAFAISSFVGRRSELREIKELLSGSRVITLTGPGGVGKSHLAHRAADALRRAYGGEVRYVDLAEARDGHLLSQELQDPDLLAHLVAGALGLDLAGAGTAMETLTASMPSLPSLLLLDNCESLLPACAVLAESLLRACPELRILATSREPLLISGEVIFPVRPLPAPEPAAQASVAELSRCDSVALFVARAEAISGFALTEQNAPAVAELCRRLDGLPLAIELAAARTRALAPAQLVQRLTERFSLLSRGNRTSPPRHQTLSDCVDSSYELCSKPEQIVWAGLSVFPGSFELDAVEGVCADESLSAAEVLESVSGLVDKSVLTSDLSGGVLRYRMLETFRDYGQRKLIEAQRQDEFRQRHRNWYEQLVRGTGNDWFSPRQAAWFARMDRELPGLRAALRYSLADPDGAEAALAMAGRLWRLWAARGRHSEGRFWLEQALARSNGPTIGRLEALYGNAALAAAQGDLAATRAIVRQTHEVATQLLDEEPAHAIVACADGVLATARGEPAEAVRSWQCAIGRLAAGQDDSWRAEALAGLAASAAMLGDADTAARCHEELFGNCPPHGDALISGAISASLGLALWKGGDLKTAAGQLREGLRLLTQIPDLPGIAQCLEVLAWIACDEMRAECAATLLGAVNRFEQAEGVRPAVRRQMPAWHQEHEQHIRAALGDRAYQAAFAGGGAMSLDEVVAYARAERRPPQPAPARDASTPLTRREQQVAELVAQGCSNSDIAAALVISRRTAESHVEKILTKLGVSNRSQVAAWMGARRQQKAQ